MSENSPRIRNDIDFFPIEQGGRRLLLIRDQIGIVPEGKVVDSSLYQLLALLDGTRTVRDIQMDLMRQRGGLLVALDEVTSLLADLDASFLLDSENYRRAKDKIVAEFTSDKIRHCVLCGRSYPEDPYQLGQMLEKILSDQEADIPSLGEIRAVVAPHIELSVGTRVYSAAYGMLRHLSPKRVVLLGIGHHMSKDLFCLTGKDFATPLGVLKNDSDLMWRLKRTGSRIIADNDFEHRSEHSIEFQILFLQHLFGSDSFRILPILCGGLAGSLPAHNRKAYLERAGLFLKELKDIILEADKETLVVAGVDLSHIGPKFGHERPAEYMANRAEAHDRKLLDALSDFNADLFWKESERVQDQYNVCGFPALACLLEILPSCKGRLLDYQQWHEAPTQSSVSFSSVLFTH